MTSLLKLAKLGPRTAQRLAAAQLSTTRPNFTSNPADQDLKVFRDNASKWWTGKEFSILRAMNQIRVPFVVDGMGKPIEEAKIIDVGCGGGILSEPLARLGAQVLGIDPIFESINQAQLHAQLDPELANRLTYRNCNIEDITAQHEHLEAYDALVASEVLEHIRDIEEFLVQCTKVIKPNGSLFVTTINQTPLSWFGVIFMGEQVLRQLPKGTHIYDMFVSVKGLRVMLERLGYHIRIVNGFMYEPLSGEFFWTPTTLTHYALQAVKMAPSRNKGLNYEQRRFKPKPAKKPQRPKRPLATNDLKSAVPGFDAFAEEIQTVLKDFKKHLEWTLSARPSTAPYETISVQLDSSGQSLALRDIAQISLKNNNLIIINLSTMPDAVKSATKAIQNHLGSNSNQIQVEVNTIYIQLPKITRESRQRLVDNADKNKKQVKTKLQAIYNKYSTTLDSSASSAKSISKDLVRDARENLRYLIDDASFQADELLRAKTNAFLDQS